MMGLLRWLFGYREPKREPLTFTTSRVPTRRRETWDGTINSPVLDGPEAKALSEPGLQPWDGRCPDCGHADFDGISSVSSGIATCRKCGTRVNAVQQLDATWMAQRI